MSLFLLTTVSKFSLANSFHANFSSAVAVGMKSGMDSCLVMDFAGAFGRKHLILFHGLYQEMFSSFRLEVNNIRLITWH
jgi:hypothetical protein